MRELYALSVLQPWAWLLFHRKDVENRSWPLPRWIVGKMVAIHASARFDRKEYESAHWLIQESCPSVVLPSPNDLAYGFIIGTLRFVEDVTEHPSPFFFGPHGWLHADAHLLEAPIRCRGALGFWRVPDEITDAVRRQMEATR